MGLGAQEEFYGCADIAIQPADKLSGSPLLRALAANRKQSGNLASVICLLWYSGNLFISQIFVYEAALAEFYLELQKQNLFCINMA